MMTFLSKYTYLFFLLLLATSLGAQEDNRPSEKEILLEKLFIEATKEKLLNNNEEAIRKYLEVLQEDITNATANYELSRLYEKQKNLEKAVLRAEKSTELEADNLLFNKQYAHVLELTGNYKKAAELYAQLTKTYPDKQYLYYEWAFYLTKDNKADQAIKVFNALEKRNGIEEATSMRKYKLYRQIGKDKKAKKELEKLIKAYPKVAEYQLRMANYYAANQEFGKAQDWYMRTLKIDPNNPTANVAMVEYFLQNGDTAKYLKALSPIFEDPNQSIDAKVSTLQPLVAGYLEGRFDKYIKAIYELSSQLVQTHPTNAQANLIWGELLFKKKQYQKATKYYLNSIKNNKNNVDLWQRLLECLLQSNDKQKLMDYSTEMLELYPSHAEAYFYNGIAQIEYQHYQKAEVQFLHAAEIAMSNKPLQAKALRYLGITYSLLSSHEKAQQHFKESLQVDPDNTDTQQAYAHSLAKQKAQLEKATTLIEEALEKQPNNTQYQTTKGLILYKQKEFNHAERILNKAINSGGHIPPETLEIYGDTLFQLGKKEEAVTYWQKALNKGSSSAVLKRKIETKQLYE